MGFSSLLRSWVPYTIYAGLLQIEGKGFIPFYASNYKLLSLITIVVFAGISGFWGNLVNAIVPEPYLDEIFHVPQAQAYCVGDFHIWDPKLTTPPGLYAFATLFSLGSTGPMFCTADNLRMLNRIFLIMTLLYASHCRGFINRLSNPSASIVSPNTLHTAFNIALFPPLFFFSGLFYTDILSTCLVLRMYKMFLKGERGIWLYITGILALTMRQTNIFWVAVFMGGLEVVRTLQSIKPSETIEEQAKTWIGKLVPSFDRYARGEIHDVPLKDAGPQDFVLCVVSIVIATITHPLLILKSLIPYLALLVSFALFIFWNDGVVLGDKQNHVATLHLPQLLYLFPFILFFSWPLVLPTCFSIFHAVTRPFFYIYKGVPSTYTPEALDKLKMKIIYTNTAVYIALVAILVIVSKNTIIHPFTLADNRHYVFYIFRYSILRHRYIRELLAPIYLISIVLCYFTLAGPPSISPPTAPASGPNTPSTSTSETKSKSKTATMIGATPSRPAPKSQAMVEEGGIKTSFPFIFLLSTSLCLITAPLVEPRYFILPWIIWRLHLPSPANGPSSFSSKANLRKGKKESGVKARAWLKKGFGKAGKEVQGNWSLWVETAWFLGINAGTGYVFLYWGFEWVQEPGRVQRFMW